MCGIVAYVGEQEALPIIIKGLKRLEYRGYDSAGVAMIDQNGLSVYKKKEKYPNSRIFLKKTARFIHKLVSDIPDGRHMVSQMMSMPIPIIHPPKSLP